MAAGTASHPREALCIVALTGAAGEAAGAGTFPSDLCKVEHGFLPRSAVPAAHAPSRESPAQEHLEFSGE